MKPNFMLVSVYFYWKFFLSVLTAIFPGDPVLVSTRMSPFWILLELRMMEAVVTTGAIRREKSPGKASKANKPTPNIFL